MDWDETPHRPRPPALRGLLVHNKHRPATEAWARDETVYNQRYDMWTTVEGRFRADERAETAPDRVLASAQRRQDYVDRFYAKFAC